MAENTNKIEASSRQITEDEKEIFEYLNDLRESGITNMFGASSYIENEFNMGRSEAKNILLLWMKNFKEDCNYEIIQT